MTLLTLDEVGRRTGQLVRRLRRWCATGELSCEREADAWLLPESALPAVLILAAAQGRFSGGRPIALAVPAPDASAEELGKHIERELGVPAGAIAMTTISIDGEEHLVAVWPSHATRNARADRLAKVAEEIGGDILMFPEGVGDGAAAEAAGV